MRGARATDLGAVVRAFAELTSEWRPLVRHDASERSYALLYRDDETEVYAVAWMNGHDTGFHDHGESHAAIIVL